MAEVLATMVVGPLVSMVKEKASSYLLDQYGVMDGMEEQHKLLKRKLPAVLDVIANAEEQAAENREGAKTWLEELRSVAYKANDVIDEFKYEALRRKAKKEGHYKEFGMDIIKLFPSHNRFVFRYRMAKKLQLILQEIDVLIAEMNIFRFKFKPQQPMPLKWRQTNPNIPDDSVNIASKSRSKEKEEIVDALLGQGGNVGLTVLPIVGMGGMGKTTLAQLVYNDSTIHKHFQLRLWVCVSEHFDVDSLAKRIVEAAEASGCQANGNMTLDMQLQNALSGKRYLLVLDDVWNREAYKWEKLRRYIHHGGIGSSVVTTTRDKNVAQFMGTINAYEIKGMDLNIIEEIIKTRAFGPQAEVPKEYKKLVGDIANRCKGSPLAATALGSVLRTKNTVQEWKTVLSRNTICDEENGILPILKLSYNCLLPHMRQCFAFCAMFPKDHEIDVEMLIRLWMANCFIPEQQGVCPEVTGQQIFNELAQRSFFLEVKKAKFDDRSYWRASDPRYYYFRITCKIHDLMHDVALDSMGKECATVDTKLKKSEDFPYTARHLFLSVDILGNVLNEAPEKGFLPIQTLICDGSRIDVQHLSKYRSLRALKIKESSFLEPKYLHHLRNLDLSGSGIKALPENITILYHLQTLNLANCDSLERLPKAMRYMTALRHLYTHGCPNLKSMPPDLGHLTSLQTLTCFVVGTDLGCSNMGELRKLDIGGHLELRELENATGADAKAANLKKKKRLEELTLSWSLVLTVDSNKEEKHKEVLDGLRPHDRLKAMRIYCYGSSAIPTWMLKLQGMVELELRGCENLEKLPALWQLPALQFLNLCGLQNLHCLFSGGAPSKFQKLKSMVLDHMPKFETWWDTDEVQEEEPIFPEVENLAILGCGSLAALPKASVIKQSSGRYGTEFCSAFPALREMKLHCLYRFHRWEVAVERTLGEEQVIFPQLEKLQIQVCPELATFPEAPKLTTLYLEGCSQEASLQAASRYIASLSSLSLHASAIDRETTLVVRDRDEWNHELSLEVLDLRRCDLFFSQSSALALWKCFGQLARLVISDSLERWPEKVFQGLASLRTLEIWWCSKLTGLTEEASDEQSSPAGAVRQSGNLPHLESLLISDCQSLVQVPNLSVSLKTLHIWSCASLQSIVFGQQEGMTMVSGEGVVVQRGEISSLIAGSISEATVSTSVPEQVTVAAKNHRCFFPCLESLEIFDCGGLTEVANLPPSMKTLRIWGCGSLVSLSENIPSLEELSIRGCPSIEQFPPSLQRRLDHLEKKVLDTPLFEGIESSEEEELDSDPESMSDEASCEHQGLMRKLVPIRLRNRMKCFRSRSQE